MKSDLVHNRVQLEPAILEQLVKEVKETVATGVALPQARKSSFGALSMYALRRNRRYTAHTRKKPQIILGFGY